MVVAQYEHDPVMNWNEGIQGDYDPSLSTYKGFTLNTSEIPSHTESSFTYTGNSNNIPNTTIIDNEGNNYAIHRETNYYYSGHRAAVNSKLTSTTWVDTLTVDNYSSAYFYTFSPNVGDASSHYRGYAFGGTALGATYQTNQAWLVWVR